MLKTVAEIKGWHLEEQWEDNVEEAQWGAVRKLEENWKSFQRGNHALQGESRKAAGPV
jgi:hypothetical protein